MVTEKNPAIAFSESMLGIPRPDSHFETAVRDTKRISASSSCVSPFRFLSSCSFSLNSIVKRSFHDYHSGKPIFHRELYHANCQNDRHEPSRPPFCPILPISLTPKFYGSHTCESVQNERAAIIEDDVRRGLGMLPQRAIFEKASEGDFAKMSKPVQVCTACQFVKA